jgi:hypothetical protein
MVLANTKLQPAAANICGGGTELKANHASYTKNRRWAVG